MAQKAPEIERFIITEDLEYVLVNLSEFAAFSGSNEKRANEKAAALHLVRFVLGNDVEINYEKSGKPYLQNGPDISITHSHDYLAVAFSRKGAVGIDIEKVRDKIINIRRKFMSAEELKQVTDSSLEEHTIYWCAKEALYKAAGIEGLIFAEQLHIQPFAFSEKGGEINAVLKHNSEKKYTLQYRTLNGHILVFTLT
ncbi:MAG: 4'-phosphopantetheinyl transferase family protein [Bacteroidia bacterium]